MLVLAAGSRGDVQPLVALAAACRKAGFEVLVATRGCHFGFFEDFGVSVVDCDMFEEKAASQSPPRGASQSPKTPLARFAATEEDTLSPGALRCMYDFAADFRPELILSGPPCLAACYVLAEHFGVPAMECALRPTAPTQRCSSPFGEPEGCPAAFHYLFWLAFRRQVWRGYLQAQLPVLQAVLNTPTVPCGWDCFQAHLLDTRQPVAPGLLAVSPAVLPAQRDASQAAPCGFLVVARQEQLTKADHMFGCRAVLRCFLDNGEPPLYLGWGPETSGDPAAMTRLAVGTAMACGRRAVILCGNADLGPGLLVGDAALKAYADTHTLFVRSAPHEWLFPRCAGVVHHGGIGTTACSLRSGVPTIVTPCNSDQLAQARLVNKLGVGVGFTRLQGLKASQLADAIQRCIGEPALLQRCQDLGTRLQAEDGVRAAIEHLDKFFTEFVAPGKWKEANERRQLEKRALRTARARPQGPAAKPGARCQAVAEEGKCLGGCAAGLLKRWAG